MKSNLLSSRSSTGRSSTYANSISSQAPLNPSESVTNQPASAKNYEAAFGQLVSQYGLSGMPVVPSKKSLSPSVNKESSRVQHPGTPSPQAKNWENAFGQLSASHGFGGFVRSLPGKR
ncbi:hypothetical protein CC2G_001950 [Coprinopsis cinerea AmutBmut pab1-1]|nr:hypothetical protein CC2G_001950 [Coprinopsis cinerea AmutBmut pab1-1]